MKKFITKNKSYSIISIASLILLGKTASLIYNNEAILPPPEKVFVVVFQLLSEASTFIAITHTLYRSLLGLLISLTLGLILGTTAGLKPTIEKLLRPILTLLKATPIISIILILLILFSTEKTPVFATFMMAFPILYTNVLEGTKNVNPKLLKMARLYKVKKFYVIKDIYLPSTAPFIFSGIESAFSIGWKVTVTAEVLNSPKISIGEKFWDAKLALDMESLFAWTILVILVSFIFEFLIRTFKKKVVRWQTHDQS